MNKELISNTESKNKILKILCFMAVLTCMAAIFYFSSQNGEQSDKISKSIVAEIKQHIPVPAIIKKDPFIQRLDYNYLLRKTTHFFEYFLLTMLAYFTLQVCGVRHTTITFIAFIFCMTYASIDEFHQSFVFRRTSRITDVLIDISGGSLFLIILYLRRLPKHRIT